MNKKYRNIKRFIFKTYLKKYLKKKQNHKKYDTPLDLSAGTFIYYHIKRLHSKTAGNELGYPSDCSAHTACHSCHDNAKLCRLA